MDEVERFYDELAPEYDLLFRDWDAAVVRQAEILDRILRPAADTPPLRILDATCGIGTQAIGLALRGHDVTATDLSPAAVERARREAARLGARLALGVADVRTLAGLPDGSFDVALAIDNALPHLVTPSDLRAALVSLSRVLRPDGRLLASIRDYDAILAATPRPTGEPARVAGDPGSRRAVAQAWAWRDGEPVYRLHQFLLREAAEGSWSVRHLEATYRALTRADLGNAAGQAGFARVDWLEPASTGFYQPILLATR